jgi:hypothetical protein
MIFSLRILDQGSAIMKGTKHTSAAPELGTSTHLTTELFKQPACLPSDTANRARTGLVTSHRRAAARTSPKDNIAPAAPASGFADGENRPVCDQPSNREFGDGVMIIIAWLIVVLMTPVDAAADAPSPAANIAPACNLSDSIVVDATYRTLRVFPGRF